jgi:lipopolysaccharide export system permease protein
MRILDRYIFRSVLGLFSACLAGFIFLYVIVDLFSRLDDILRHQVSPLLLQQYYLANIPIIFVQVVPIACLLATLYTYAKLNRDNEVIAMRASGLSILQMTSPVIIFGLIVSLFVFWVNDRYVVKALEFTQRAKAQMEGESERAKGLEHQVIKNLSMYGFKNRLFFANTFTPATNTMEGITILEHDDQQNITKKVVAKKGVFEKKNWKFYQSITYTFDENGMLEPQYLDEEMMTFTETPQDFLNQRQRPDYMTIGELDNYIWKLSKSGATTVIRNLQVELYQRFTLPLTSIIIILLGIPFALKIRKRATGLSSFGLSLIVGFLYYVLNAISLALGKAGILSPVLAASLSHGMGLLLSIYFINTIP